MKNVTLFIVLIALSACSSFVYTEIPDKTEFVSVRVDGESFDRVITDRALIERLSELITSVEPVKAKMLHGAVTYASKNEIEIGFRTIATTQSFYYRVGRSYLRNQYAFGM